jgi:hypothetical protein
MTGETETKEDAAAHVDVVVSLHKFPTTEHAAGEKTFFRRWLARDGWMIGCTQ